MRTSLCWLLALSVALPSRRAEACGVIVERPPLGAQIEAARAIVLVRVEGHSTEPLFLDDESEPLHFWVEHLRVVRTLKGSVPVRFRAGRGELSDEAHGFSSEPDAPTRLLFVRATDEEDDGPVPLLAVEELSVDDPEDLAVFLDRIEEAAHLKATGGSAEQEREWLVRCAMRRATRGHAVQALLAGVGRLPKRDEPPLAPELSQAQRRAILDGFRQEPSTDGSFVGVLALGQGIAHPAFDRVAVGAVETLLAVPEGAMSFDAPQALLLVMQRLGVPEAEARWSAAYEASEEAEDLEASQRLWCLRHLRLRALWNALRAEGHLVPSPFVPSARSAVDLVSLSAD